MEEQFEYCCNNSSSPCDHLSVQFLWGKWQSIINIHSVGSRYFVKFLAKNHTKNILQHLFIVKEACILPTTIHITTRGMWNRSQEGNMYIYVHTYNTYTYRQVDKCAQIHAIGPRNTRIESITYVQQCYFNIKTLVAWTSIIFVLEH